MLKIYAGVIRQTLAWSFHVLQRTAEKCAKKVVVGCSAQVIRFQNIRIHPSTPYRIRTLRICFFFPLWRAGSNISGFAAEFAGCLWTEAVSGKKKGADVKISGYV